MTPPFKITSKIIESLTKITFVLGKTQSRGLVVPSPLLRKENQIRTIHSTLAIEGNSLTEGQVTDIIDGKKILGRTNEILEVKNTVKLYEKVNEFQSIKVKDFLSAHSVLMTGLISEAGKFRSKNVGIIKGKKVIHTAPQPKLVNGLIENHFKWLKEDSDTNPILKSCISHYEIEFIHPFMDGNGRIGRFWQTLILSSVDPVFKFLPIESIIHSKQEEYYKALELSDKEGESTKFIEFMLEVLLEALNEFIEQAPSSLNTQENRLEIAKERFKDKNFSRKEYISAMPEISTATASRDLKKWLDKKVLSKTGNGNQTKYIFY